MRVRRRDVAALVIIMLLLLALLLLAPGGVQLARTGDVPAAIPAPVLHLAPMIQHGEPEPPTFLTVTPTPVPPSIPRVAPPRDFTPPTHPDGLTAEAQGDSHVDVTWLEAEDDVGVVHYVLRQDGAPALEVSGTTFVSDGLQASTMYCFTVEAVDAAGNHSTPAGPVCAKTGDAALPRAETTAVLDVEPPSAPRQVMLSVRSPTQLGVRWEPGTDDIGVVAYEIHCGNIVRRQKLVTTAEVRELEPDRRYCVTVYALDDAGNMSKPSLPACARTAIRETPQDLDVQIESVWRDHVTLTWRADADHALHRIYTTEGKLVGETPRNTILHLREPSDDKCYVVRAYDRDNREVFASRPVCITTGRTAAR